MAKPIIGITSFSDRASFCDDIEINAADRFEIDKLLKAGGLPILIPLHTNVKDLWQYLKVIQGLLLPGGADVSPSFYMERPSAKTEPPCLKRDKMEITLIREAVKRKMPVLGICRGCQIINVAFGGSLHQDIKDCLKTKIEHNQDYHKIALWKELSHKVKISPNSKLRQIIGRSHIKTNSLHHQAIKKVGRGLSVCAMTYDKVIEAIEKTNFNQFLLGVQWHVESVNNCDNLFFEFVKYAKILQKELNFLQKMAYDENL